MILFNKYIRKFIEMYKGLSFILYILCLRIYFLYDCIDRFLVCILYVKEKIVRISMFKIICLDNWWLLKDVR